MHIVLLARLFAASLLFLCPGVSAMEETIWNFRGTIPANLQVNNLTTVESTEEGLYVKTTSDGFIQMPALSMPADVLTMTYTNVEAPEIALLWQPTRLKTGEYYQHNIQLAPGPEQQSIVSLHLVEEWDPTSPTIGLAFSAGSELLIKQIEWRAYTPLEKLWNGFLSFWTPDEFRMYSINFIWGPLIGATPESRATLFELLPPPAWSATRIFYGIFGVALLSALILWRTDKENGKKRFWQILVGTVVVLWIVFDVRMTQEIFAYVRNDWQSYVLQPTTQKTLRTHSGLHAILMECKKLLGDDARYGLIATNNSPYFSNTRYSLLPAIPIREGEDATGVKAWLVFDRSDITVNENGALVQSDGTVIAERGSILKRFDERSFFYRAQ